MVKLVWNLLDFRLLLNLKKNRKKRKMAHKLNFNNLNKEKKYLLFRKIQKRLLRKSF